MTSKTPTNQKTPVQQKATAAKQLTVIKHKPAILNRARTQWQFGDWQTLANTAIDNLDQHPDKAELALLIATANLQLDATEEAHHWLKQAKAWHCDEQLLQKLLTAGSYNSLGRIYLLKNQPKRAQEHFTNALTLGAPEEDIQLLAQARSNCQLQQIKD